MSLTKSPLLNSQALLALFLLSRPQVKEAPDFISFARDFFFYGTYENKASPLHLREIAYSRDFPTFIL